MQSEMQSSEKNIGKIAKTAGKRRANGRFAFVLAGSVLPSAASAHPGHGVTETFGALHHLLDPFHGGVVVVAAVLAAAAAAGVVRLRRRTQRSRR